jgi:hypothetical protein
MPSIKHIDMKQGCLEVWCVAKGPTESQPCNTLRRKCLMNPGFALIAVSNQNRCRMPRIFFSVTSVLRLVIVGRGIS